MKENKALEAALLEMYPKKGEKLVERLRENISNSDFPSNENIENVADALDRAFDWELSPEGRHFWGGVYIKLKKNDQKEILG